MSALYVGLMSGTSLDGIDAALVAIDESNGHLDAELKAFISRPYLERQREQIKAALEPGYGVRDLTLLNYELGEWFAEATFRLLDVANVTGSSLAGIGSHGQTLWHVPPSGGATGATLQLGEPAVIAEAIGAPVVSDFRARDVAAGGHGAPLVPLVDCVLFSHPERDRALQNIGGIANVTFVPSGRGSSLDDVKGLVAFDTGPGVAVVDAVVSRITDGAQSFDADGRRAAAAVPNEDLLAALLTDPYWARHPPKSTGREHFGSGYAENLILEGRRLGISDENVLVATATELTARTIADAYERFMPAGMKLGECIVSGGGARNPVLMDALAEALAPTPVLDLRRIGWDPDAKEAVAFAVLAHLFFERRPGNVPSATGAVGRRILGKLTLP